jgi:hypothetical protein
MKYASVPPIWPPARGIRLSHLSVIVFWGAPILELLAPRATTITHISALAVRSFHLDLNTMYSLLTLAGGEPNLALRAPGTPQVR